MRRKLVLDYSVSEYLCQLRKPQCLQVSRLLKVMADTSSIASSVTTRDDTGRVIHHQTIGHWRISYWEDAPVNELRILDIRRDS